MKTEEIARRLHELHSSAYTIIAEAVDHYHADVLTEAADALDTQAREIESMRKAFETIFPARDGFTEAFDDLVTAGLLVEVPSDAAFREWWGDEPTMWVWRWHPLAGPSKPEEASDCTRMT